MTIYTPGDRVTAACTDATYDDRSGRVEYIYEYQGRDIIGVWLDGARCIAQFAPDEIRKEA